MSQVQEVIYDNRVNEILKELSRGRTREEISKDYDYANYKSLDMYLRRRGFKWNGETYIPEVTRLDTIKEDLSSSIPIKAERIMKMIDDGKDIRTIADDMGFKDHRDMAEYMKDSNLYWNSDMGNYEEDISIKHITIEENDEKDEYYKNVIKDNVSLLDDKIDIEGLDSRYIDLLELLYEHKDKLLNILVIGDKNIPIYAVPGTAITKSIYMSELLSRLITDFSKTKNISQRDIVETAIIEYLSKYGYENEIKVLLDKK